MNLFDEIDARREQWDVLRHPFYRRWSEGSLSRPELAAYAGQYRHAVVALAEASRLAAIACDSAEDRALLEAHAAEEFEHLALWDRFASALGTEAPAEPTSETDECVRAWFGARDGDLSRSLTTLYAIESSQPRISEVKRSGLVDHYGFEAGSDAIGYFDVHAVRDHDHAAQHRTLLTRRLDRASTSALAGAAEEALAGNWRLLDGVERICGERVAAPSEGR